MHSWQVAIRVRIRVRTRFRFKASIRFRQRAGLPVRVGASDMPLDRVGLRCTVGLRAGLAARASALPPDTVPRPPSDYCFHGLSVLCVRATPQHHKHSAAWTWPLVTQAGAERISVHFSERPLDAPNWPGPPFSDLGPACGPWQALLGRAPSSGPPVLEPQATDLPGDDDRGALSAHPLVVHLERAV